MVGVKTLISVCAIYAQVTEEEDRETAPDYDFVALEQGFVCSILLFNLDIMSSYHLIQLLVYGPLLISKILSCKFDGSVCTY